MIILTWSVWQIHSFPWAFWESFCIGPGNIAIERDYHNQKDFVYSFDWVCLKLLINLAVIKQKNICKLASVVYVTALRNHIADMKGASLINRIFLNYIAQLKSYHIHLIDYEHSICWYIFVSHLNKISYLYTNHGSSVVIVISSSSNFLICFHFCTTCYWNQNMDGCPCCWMFLLFAFWIFWGGPITQLPNKSYWNLFFLINTRP